VVQLEAMMDYVVGAKEMTFLTIYIVADVRGNKGARGAFSVEGDSGACVFDIEGRTVGVVGAGRVARDGEFCGKPYTETDPTLPQSRSPAFQVSAEAKTFAPRSGRCRYYLVDTDAVDPRGHLALRWSQR
jgi:hypothetical protein